MLPSPESKETLTRAVFNEYSDGSPAAKLWLRVIQHYVNEQNIVPLHPAAVLDLAMEIGLNGNDASEAFLFLRRGGRGTPPFLAREGGDEGRSALLVPTLDAFNGNKIASDAPQRRTEDVADNMRGRLRWLTDNSAPVPLPEDYKEKGLPEDLKVLRAFTEIRRDQITQKLLDSLIDTIDTVAQFYESSRAHQHTYLVVLAVSLLGKVRRFDNTMTEKLSGLNEAAKPGDIMRVREPIETQQVAILQKICRDLLQYGENSKNIKPIKAQQAAQYSIENIVAEK